MKKKEGGNRWPPGQRNGDGVEDVDTSNAIVVQSVSQRADVHSLGRDSKAAAAYDTFKI